MYFNLTFHHFSSVCLHLWGYLVETLSKKFISNVKECRFDTIEWVNLNDRMLSKDQNDFRRLRVIEVLFPKIWKIKKTGIYLMGNWFSSSCIWGWGIGTLSPDGFWGNFALVNPLLNFLRNILISKWLPAAPSPMC